MRELIDITGEKFNRLDVIRREGSDKFGNATWFCECDCGNERIVSGRKLRIGHTKSCGCLQIEINIQRSTKHGARVEGKFTPEYSCWTDMIKRCTNAKSVSYKNYGGRGIEVCDRWLHSFENFFEDMGPKPSLDYSIERKHVNGNYELSNCVWLLSSEQSKNRRIHGNNTSGHKGISWDKEAKKWLSFIGVEKKMIKLGRFDDIGEAIEARKKAELKYWGKASV